MLTVLALIAAAVPARATEPLEGVQLRGVTAAVSTGYAAPAGALAPGVRLSSVVRDAWPIRVDLGHRFTSSLRATFSLAYAPARAHGGSDVGNVVLAGGEAAWLFTSWRHVEPWVALGAAYESLSVDVGEGAARREWKARGWAFPMLRAGIAWRLSRHVAFGPVVGVHFGRFTSADVERTGAPNTFDRVGGSGWHRWTEAGVRAMLDL